LCDAFGQKIPFPQTRAERLSSGDPRPSLEERYPSADSYTSAVIRAVSALRDQRFLLEEDAALIAQRASKILDGSR
jgi:hypothetical protein